MPHAPRARGVLLSLCLLTLTSIAPAGAQKQDAQRRVAGLMARFVARPLRSRTDEEISDLKALGKRAVGPLAKILSDQKASSEQLRSWAAYMLRRVGQPDAVPHLVKALDDPSWRVRKNAANSLGALGLRSVIPRLLRLLSDPISTVHQSAGGALNKLSTRADLPLLIAAYREQKQGRVRTGLVHLIGQLELAEATPFMVGALRDPAPRCRTYAIYYLISSAPAALRAELPTLLADKDPAVRVMAVRALPMLGRPFPESTTLKLLSDPSSKVRREVASSLMFFSGAAVGTGLMAALTVECNNGVRLALASALGRSRPLTAYAELQACVEDQTLPESLRAQALYALARLPLRQSITSLIAALGAQSNLHRQIAHAQLQVLTGQTFDGSAAVIQLQYERWWRQNNQGFSFPSAESRQRKAGAKLRSWRTRHHELLTNVDSLLAERILLTMELMHEVYNRQYTAPTPLVARSAALLLALGAARSETSAGIRFRFLDGRTVIHGKDGQRRAWHPDGRRVTLRANGARQIRFPWGQNVTRWPRSKSSKRTRIQLFLRRRGYRAYAKKADSKWPFLQDAGGYYSPTRQEIVTYSKPSHASVLNTLTHEAQHQVLSTHLRRSPVWLNEGLSEYYEQSTMEQGVLQRHIHKSHLKYVARLLRERSQIPLRTLVRLNYNAFHNDSFGPAEIGHYAQSWSLVYFLLEAENGRYRSLFTRYFEALRDGASSQPAFAHYLKAHRLDWESLEKRWATYVLRLARQQERKKKPRPQGDK